MQIMVTLNHNKVKPYFIVFLVDSHRWSLNNIEFSLLTVLIIIWCTNIIYKSGEEVI